MRVLASFLILSLIFSSCASAPKNPSGAAEASITSTLTEESLIGQKINAEIMSSFYPYTDPQVMDYVTRIGNALAAQADRKELAYRFTVLYNEKIYATSAPGGYVYLTTGLVNFLQNESELAAVMAHEIGELQYRDPRLSRSKKILDSITRGGATVAPAFGQIGMLAVLGLAMLNMAADAKSGKMTPEMRLLDADARALHYMVEAGFDPQGMIDLFHSLASAESGLQPYFSEYYQSRPITPERVENLQKIFAGLPLTGKTFETHPEIYQETTKGIREIYKQ